MPRLFRRWSQALNAERLAMIVGFGFTICGLLRAQLYLELAQRQHSDIEEQLFLADLLSTKKETAANDVRTSPTDKTSADDRVMELTATQQLTALALQRAQELNARRKA